MFRGFLEGIMADNVGFKVTYFLVGMGIGALVGVLFAPKSGEETRKFLSDKAEEGRDYAQKKARELRERADDLVERGKETASRHKESITAAGERADMQNWVGIVVAISLAVQVSILAALFVTTRRTMQKLDKTVSDLNAKA